MVEGDVKRDFAGYAFERVGLIDPARDASGIVLEFMPQARYRNTKDLPLNKYGAGPFCRFSIAKGVKAFGVYVVTVAGRPTYIGECHRQTLAERFGWRGYGAIQPRNCFRGGQSVNCKVNSFILKHVKAGDEVELWFLASADPVPVQNDLIRMIRPFWNTQIP